MSDALTRLKSALADRYRHERELGAGGMATVYLAEDLKHKRKVALKGLKPELAAVLGAPDVSSEPDQPYVHCLRVVPGWVKQMKRAVDEANRSAEERVAVPRSQS